MTTTTGSSPTAQANKPADTSRTREVFTMPARQINRAYRGTMGTPNGVRIIRSFAEFSEIKAEWDGFLGKIGNHNFSLSHDNLMAWASVFKPEQLHIVIVLNAQGDWLGMAPFQIAMGRTGYSQKLLRHLQFLGTQPTTFDKMGIVVHPQADEASTLATIASTLLREKWDLLDLVFCHEGDQLQTFCKLLGYRPDSESFKETMPIPTLPLPGNLEEFQATRRKKTRLDVNRLNNRMRKEAGQTARLVYHRCDTPESTQKSLALLEHFTQGHIQYWAERGVKSEFKRYPKLIDYYKTLLLEAEKNPGDDGIHLRFTTLELGDRILSYQLGFWQRDMYLSHLTHYEENAKVYSPGTIHMENLVLETLVRGGHTFEFGRGDEPYKRLWTKTLQPLYNLRVFRSPLQRGIWEIDAILKRLTGKVAS